MPPCAAVLEAGYDDADGVTAAFNLNLLRRINREAEADFPMEQFGHRAVFNASASRVEMHLVSTQGQVVTVAGTPISFAQRETIWTESSCRYDLPMLEAVTTSAGFRLEQLWTDAGERFRVGFFTAA